MPKRKERWREEGTTHILSKNPQTRVSILPRRQTSLESFDVANEIRSRGVEHTPSLLCLVPSIHRAEKERFRRKNSGDGQDRLETGECSSEDEHLYQRGRISAVMVLIRISNDQYEGFD